MKAANPNVGRRDAVGHLSPAYQSRLLALSGSSRSAELEDFAFIARRRTREDIGEELGEAFVSGATSGQDVEFERLDRVTEEELGGPFVLSSAGSEFAAGTDESNIEGATREPFPRTSRVEP